MLENTAHKYTVFISVVMVRIIVVLLNTAAMETKVVIWLNFSTVIFTRLYGTCSFHLCLSCFDSQGKSCRLDTSKSVQSVYASGNKEKILRAFC